MTYPKDPVQSVAQTLLLIFKSQGIMVFKVCIQ